MSVDINQIGAFVHQLSPQQERRLFAAMAMQGLLASGHNEIHRDYGWAASRSVEMADALIAELAKGAK
jgi:hypothetical protein